MADTPSTPSTRKIKIALARQTPAFVRVERSDGDPVLIKPHGSRGKWQRVMESIPTDGVRIELLDKTKAVLWAHVIDQGDDVDDVDEVKHAAGIDRIDQMFQLVQTANDVAQRRAQEFMEHQQAASLKVIDVLTARLVQLEANYSNLLQLAADSSQKGAPEDSEMDTENKNMMNIVLKAGIDKGIDRFLPAKNPKPKLKAKAKPNGKAATNG